MPTAFLRALARALDAPGAPPPGDHVLVAASGGPDSTALLSGLVSLGRARGLRVSVGHVDHRLRGPESEADRVAVTRLAAALAVECLVATAAVAPGGNLEERARDARRRALLVLARRAGAGVIALGHTEDDQVETVLLRLLRGAGRGALGGMHERRGRFWRPLLGTTRADVRRHLAIEGLAYRLDRSNADLRHARNRLRRLVVPLLAREFNPALGTAVARLSERLRDEDRLLAELACTRAEVHRRGDALARSVADEPPALARRIVHAWLVEHGGRGIAASLVERTLALAAGRRHGNVAVPGAARIVCERDVLVRHEGLAPTVRAFRHQVDGPCTIAGPEGAWRLSIAPARPRGEDELRGLSTHHARFDAHALAGPLVVRSVEPGDRIDVPGVGRRKLQDVLVDAKVPRERRRLVPLVSDATGGVVWVAGVLRGAAAPITPSTTHVIDMTVEG